MMNYFRIAIVLLGVGRICLVQAAAPDMQPGLWEITMQLEMSGMPVAMPPISQQMYFTAQDVESGAMTMSQDNHNNCRVEGFSMNGNNASWSMKCDNMTGQGTMTYSEDSYSGTSDIRLNMDGNTQQMKQIFSGRRLSDCRK